MDNNYRTKLLKSVRNKTIICLILCVGAIITEVVMRNNLYIPLGLLWISMIINSNVSKNLIDYINENL